MEMFNGSVRHGGRVALPKVSGVMFRYASRTGQQCWGGSFSVPHGQGIPLGTGFRLVTDDGSILIFAPPAACLSQDIALFEGSGPLQ